jgi:hypothetical protein
VQGIAHHSTTHQWFHLISVIQGFLRPPLKISKGDGEEAISLCRF